jgi:hypothetical protein
MVLPSGLFAVAVPFSTRVQGGWKGDHLVQRALLALDLVPALPIILPLDNGPQILPVGALPRPRLGKPDAQLDESPLYSLFSALHSPFSPAYSTLSVLPMLL